MGGTSMVELKDEMNQILAAYEEYEIFLGYLCSNTGSLLHSINERLDRAIGHL